MVPGCSTSILRASIPVVAILSSLAGGNICLPSMPHVKPGSEPRVVGQGSRSPFSATSVSSAGKTGLKSPAARPRPALRSRAAMMEIWWGL